MNQGESAPVQNSIGQEPDKICAICQSQMNSLAFFADGEQGTDGDAFRLSCKHAFHPSCILLAFRTSSSTACPCCRNTEGVSNVQVVTRGRFSLHVTEMMEDTEEEEEVDMTELMNSDPILKKIRCGNESIKCMRKNYKDARKTYNIFRDLLRQKRKEYLKIALKEFRCKYRNEYRELQFMVIQKAKDLYEAEKTVYIEETSQEIYDVKPWIDAHKEESFAKLKIIGSETRHTDPYNSTFWYA